MTSFLKKQIINKHRVFKNLESPDNIVNNKTEINPTYVRYKTDYRPEHRGGWSEICASMDANLDFNEGGNNEFYDNLDIVFLFHQGKIQTKNWIGILHILPYKKNTHCVFKKPNFIKSLKKCKGIITLGPNLRDYVIEKLKEHIISVPVHLIKHPIEFSDVPEFSFEKYVQNLDKYIIQIGQQDRKISSLGIINSPGHTKLWLTGIKDIRVAQEKLDVEKKELGRVFPPFKMRYTKTFAEYDTLLSENIVFLDFHLAVANNTVVECLLRNTPLILNKTDSLKYYLGDEYPLFYTNLDEVPDLLSLEKILEATIYLKNRDKTGISMEYFLESLRGILNI